MPAPQPFVSFGWSGVLLNAAEGERFVQTRFRLVLPGSAPESTGHGADCFGDKCILCGACTTKSLDQCLLLIGQ
jgi:hypothetical protein